MHDKILDTKLQAYANSIIHQRKSWSTRLKNHNSDMSHYISNINPLYKVKVVKHHAYNLSVVNYPAYLLARILSTVVHSGLIATMSSPDLSASFFMASFCLLKLFNLVLKRGWIFAASEYSFSETLVFEER